MAGEKIDTNVQLAPKPQRLGAGEKAQQIAGRARRGKIAEPRYQKVTARVIPDQVSWLRKEVKQYTEKNPMKPKLTMDELMRIAVEHLREAGSVEKLVSKYRA
jgi:hypothetical protein